MANGKGIFRSDIPFGNFELPFKTFHLFQKISVRANQNGLTIYIPTEISGIFRQMVNNLFIVYLFIHMIIRIYLNNRIL